MTRCLIIFLAFLCSYISSFSQELSEENSLKIDSISLDQSKEQDNLILSDSIIKLNGLLVGLISEKKSIEQDLKQSRLDFQELKIKKQNLDSINSKKIEEKDSIISELQNQISALGVLDDIIVKQCLLFPLERSFDKDFVDNCSSCLQNLKIGDNVKFKDLYNVYYPLLGEYSRYNEEVYSFLKSQFESFRLKQWKLSDSYKTMLIANIKNLKYYELYKDKDQEPWRSILFLDGIIDDFTLMLSGKKELSEENMINLINSMGK